MGTRHLIIVYYKGEYHIVQYGQWDGNPSGQGVRVLKFLSVPANITALKASIDNGMLYTPTDEELDALYAEANKRSYENRDRFLQRPIEGDSDDIWRKDWLTRDYPSLTRNLSTGILEVVAQAKEPVPVIKDLEFVEDSLGCEWMYMVDSDERVMEVYRSNYEGNRRNDLRGMGRLSMMEELKTVPNLTACFRLAELPDEEEFLRKSEMKDEEEEDAD